MSSMLFLDIETTGTDPFKHMVTEIAAEYHVDGKKVNEFFTAIKQVPTENTAIDLGALQVTNTNLKKTMVTGKPEAEALFELVDWLLSLKAKRMRICGHNVNFDINFLKILFTRYRIEGWDSLFSYKVEDTCTTALTMTKAGLLPESNCSLGNLVEIFDIENDKDLHSATVDVDLTAKVYYKMLELLGQKND